MPLPVRAALLAAAAVLAAPATSMAASTLTVDPSHPAGCDAQKTCRTISEAVAAAAAGDTIKVLKGTYAENVTVPAALTGLRIQGQPEVKLTGTGTGDVLTLQADGVEVSGLAIDTPGGASSAVRVDPDADGAVLRSLVVARTAASSSQDALVDIAGAAQLASMLIAQQTGAAGTPAIASAGAGGTQLADVVALSVTGPVARFSTSDKNTVVRSTLLSAEPKADTSNAVELLSSNAGARRLVVDSSILVGGAAAAGLKVVTSGASAGDAALDLRHVTIAGARGAIVLDASEATGGLQGAPPAKPSGGITATVASSIVHGASSAAGYQSPDLGLVTATNAVKLTYDRVDGPQPTGSGGADVSAARPASNTDDAKLFASGFTLRADAPVIDQGGAPASGQSDKDVQGDPRVSGAASDLGADEYVNKPPKAAFGVTNANPRQGEGVGFVSGSTDPEEVAKAGGSIVEYRWDFGDGTTQTTKVGGVAHTYANVGTYTATLVVVDERGAVSQPATQTVTVKDGIAPVAAIDTPVAGARLPLNPKAKKPRRAVKRKKARRPRPIPLTVLGKATDASGVTKVELALTLVKRDPVSRKRSKRKRARRSAIATCEHFSGRYWVEKECGTPLWVDATLRGDTFQYVTPKGKRLPAGRYELRVRATDGAGLVSSVFTSDARSLVAFRVR